MDEIETRQVGKPGGCPCPKCGYIDTKVVDSRPAVDALKRGSVKRRRQCYRCETRYTTMEIAFPLPVTGNYMKRLSDLEDNIGDVLRDIKALKAFHAATDGLS